MNRFQGRICAILRVKDEELWLSTCLDTLTVLCNTVVILDDNSTDHTPDIVRSFSGSKLTELSDGWIWKDSYGDVLRYIKNPYTTPDEARDKDVLWMSMLTICTPDWVLAMDGDEAFSRRAISYLVESPNLPDVGVLPFIYLWDSVGKRRIDGIYGDAQDGYPKLRFPRILCTRDIPYKILSNLRYKRTHRGPNLHCGSLPTLPDDLKLSSGLVGAEVLHFGYIDPEVRLKKYTYYNTIDPHNSAEGEYLHIIGKPDLHAPGPVKLVDFVDDV